MSKSEQPQSRSHAAVMPYAQASLEFIDRARGTLPEVVSEGDLETLNTGLRFFFADLRHAWDLYQRSEGHGRAGAAIALGAAWRFIALFQQPLAETLHIPILRLQDVLAALDNNNVDPMLAPVPRRGRASSIGAREALRGQVAAAATRLMQAGLPRRQAHIQVAKALVTLGMRPERGSGKITATTVRHWCDEVVADVGNHGVAATVYHGMFTQQEGDRFAGLPSDLERRSFALASLAGFVRDVFPETRSRD